MVLALAEHITGDTVRPLAAEEDRCLRQVFGRYGDPQAVDIARATKLLLDLRQEAGGRCWLRCDCERPIGETAPLMTISGDAVLRPHIRRLEGPGRGHHSLDCDFSTDGDEEERHGLTYERRPLVGGRRLLRVVPKALLSPEVSDRGPVTPSKRQDGGSRPKARPPLGRLLAEVMTEAGLQRMGHDETYIEIGDQYRRLRAAAERINLTRGVRLRDYFHTHFPRISAFRAKLKNADPALFFPAPPHGIFLGVADTVKDATVSLHGGGTVVLPTRVAMSADYASGAAHNDYEGPFMVAILYASLNKEFGQPVQAYLQPVLSAKRLMLLATGAERHGLQQIRKLQKGIINSGVLFDIERPLFTEKLDHSTPDEISVPPTFFARRVQPLPAISLPIVSSRVRAASSSWALSYDIALEADGDQELRDAQMRRDLRRALLSR